jgi:hypothetical protein
VHSGVLQAAFSPLFAAVYVRDLFLRLLGLIFAVAFFSLHSQVSLLYGGEGLMPAVLSLAGGAADWLARPTVFWVDHSDTALRFASLAGAVLSFGLVLNLAPRYCLVGCWALYLSFVTIGAPFLNFQWDNLLLETAACAFFITPAGLRPSHASPPHPAAVLLMQWLLFRLHFESGVAKLVSGDPTWRDLTAMVSYYETAPLPTWIGWYMHQLPIWAHRVTSALTLIVELVVPWFIWSPLRLRRVALGTLLLLQAFVVLTANYTFFNYLTVALCLFMLDDREVGRIARRVGLVPASARRPPASWRGLLVIPAAALMVAVSFLPFLRFLGMLPAELAGAQRAIDAFRLANAYHLFANMTLIRREVVIEGSNDGENWLEYEFRYKPGDVLRAPPFVAPHQPRVDFQLWFLMLGRRWGAPYFDRLIQRLLTTPESMAPLFARMPFGKAPPRLVRIAVYGYRFTDLQTRRASRAWWQRELILRSNVHSRAP